MINSHLGEELTAECLRHLAVVEEELVGLKNPGGTVDPEPVHSVLRHLHSIKGASGYLESPSLHSLSDAAETVVISVRDCPWTIDQAAVDLLLRTVDRLEQVLRSPAPAVDVTADVQRLESFRRSAEAPRAGPVPRELRSLVVEDEFTSRIILQDFLRRLGECHVAVNGREAVEACSLALALGRPYDLICMDVNMPEMDGREAVRRIRAQEDEHGVRSTQGARIVMTTAVNDMRSVFQTFGDLCDGYLCKPFDLRQLAKQLQMVGVMGG